MNIKRLKTHSR